MALDHYPSPHSTNLGKDYWCDNCIPVCEPDQLRTYLLTGDRPMRMMEKWGIGAEAGGDVGVGWQATIMRQDAAFRAYRQFGWRSPTPAEAILACAMEVV